MTVVAVLGILAAIALPMISRNVDVQSVARTVASQFGEVGRLAVTRGPIHPDILAAETIPDPTRAYVEVVAGDPAQIVTWIRVDDLATGTVTPFEIERYTLPKRAILAGGTLTAETNPLPGGTDPAPISTSLEAKCRPDGTCDPMTIYLQRDNGADRFRVILMPLSTGPMVIRGW